MWLKKLAVSYPDGDSSIKSILFYSTYPNFMRTWRNTQATDGFIDAISLFGKLWKNGISCVK